MMTGSICFEGFEHLADIQQHMIDGGNVSVSLFHTIAAGLHPDGAVVIKKIEDKNGS